MGQDWFLPVKDCVQYQKKKTKKQDQREKKKYPGDFGHPEFFISPPRLSLHWWIPELRFINPLWGVELHPTRARKSCKAVISASKPHHCQRAWQAPPLKFSLRDEKPAVDSWKCCCSAANFVRTLNVCSVEFWHLIQFQRKSFFLFFFGALFFFHQNWQCHHDHELYEEKHWKNWGGKQLRLRNDGPNIFLRLKYIP